MSPRDVMVTGVNFKVIQNAQSHNTDRYQLVHEQGTPILRRGQGFVVEVNFRNGVYDPDHHAMAFIFTYLNDADEYDGTKGVAVVGGDSRYGWMARVDVMGRSSGIFKVAAPRNALVGEWKMTVALKYQGNRKDFPYPGPIYILFNPWNDNDSVYMPQEDLLSEYVLQDVGKIWKIGGGSTDGIRWIYGQFGKIVLPAILKMLRRCRELRPTKYGDPVEVSRAISCSVNKVLAGNWTDNPCDLVPNRSQCVLPDEWSGSVEILERWINSGYSIVKYGQCFNLAGLTTTACRALGIAARNVTCKDSGVDKDYDLLITKFKDRNGNEIANNKDAIWTFHVWNEVYMARPDLPHGYGGWQAIDGTLQFNETDKCGPASVAAIKAGDCRWDYDVRVFVAATNANCISLQKEGNTVTNLLKWVPDVIGLGMYTKKPTGTIDPNGESDRLDIISTYKYPEGSMEESNSLRMAKNFAVQRNIPAQNEDLKVKAIPGATINVGQILPITFKVKNNSTQWLIVRAVMNADSVYYNGPKGHNLKTEERTLRLGPGQVQELAYTIHPNQYIGKLVDYGAVYSSLFVSSATAGAVGDGYYYFRHPGIYIEKSGPLRINQRNSFRFSFTNRLHVPLTECKIYYFSSGVDIVREKRYRNINPFERVTIEEYFTPRIGSFSLSVTFECKEMIRLNKRIQY